MEKINSNNTSTVLPLQAGGVRGGSPYIGPRSYRTGETLYGRRRETMELLDLLIAERIVLLYSPSGAGKTSLIQAALLPELEREGFRVLPTMRVNSEPPERDALADVPHNRYILSLLLSLEADLPDAEQTPLTDLALTNLSDYLDRRFPADAGDDDLDQSSVLIFDQFEEILTVDPTDRGDKLDFFVELGEALRDRNRWALFSMREEFVTGLDSYLRPLPTRLTNTYRLELLGPEAAMQAVQRPAEKAGVTFSDAAAQKLVGDLRRVRVQEADGRMVEAQGLTVEPVQLQVVCHRLWEKLPPGATRIDVTDVDDVGDVDDALRAYYAECVAAIAERTGVRERAMRDWVDRQLITEGGIRGQVLQGVKESAGLPNRAIWPLVDTHLVRAEKRRGATWFELAHDRLIDPVRADNAAWRTGHLVELQRRADLWQRENRTAGLLLAGEELVEAEAWTEAHKGELEEHEEEFLAASREVRRVERRERRFLTGMGALTVLAVVTAVMAFFFFWNAHAQAQLAQQQTRRAKASELAAYVQVELSSSPSAFNPSRALLLAGEAISVTWPEDGYVHDNANRALMDAITAVPPWRTILRHNIWEAVNSAAFSPDGTLLVTASGGRYTESGSDNTAGVWNAKNGERLLALIHDGYVTSVAFSPDGTQVVTADEGGMAGVWDTKTGERILVLPHDDSINSAAFSPDGTWLVTASNDNTAGVWDAETGERLLLLPHNDDVNFVAFSPDGMLLVTASGSPWRSDHTAGVWDAKTGERLLSLPHDSWVYSAIFSLNGARVVTTSDDDTVGIWDAQTGERLLSLPHNGVTLATFSPDGTQLVTTSGFQLRSDGTAKVWDAETGERLLSLIHDDSVNSAAFSPDGTQIVTASNDNTAGVWDAETGERLLLLPHNDWVHSAAFSPDGAQVVTASNDGTAIIWVPEIGDRIPTLTHDDSINSAAFSPDGTWLVTASDDNTAGVWDAESGERLLSLPHGGRVNSASFSPNGARIVTASVDGIARIWEAERGERLLSFNHASISSMIFSAAFSPDGARVVTAGEDGTAGVWDASTGERLILLTHEEWQWVNSASFSPNGARIVTASVDGTARVWDARTGEQLFFLSHDRFGINSAAFSPDGAWVVTASSTARVWDAETGRQNLSLSHGGAVNSAAFSPDGAWVVTAGSNGMAGVWDAESGERLLSLPHGDWVNSAAFSPDGTKVVTASSDGMARIWPASPDGWLDLAHSLVLRDPPVLTDEERRRYGLTE